MIENPKYWEEVRFDAVYQHCDHWLSASRCRRSWEVVQIEPRVGYVSGVRVAGGVLPNILRNGVTVRDDEGAVFHPYSEVKCLMVVENAVSVALRVPLDHVWEVDGDD